MMTFHEEIYRVGNTPSCIDMMLQEFSTQCLENEAKLINVRNQTYTYNLFLCMCMCVYVCIHTSTQHSRTYCMI